MGELEGAAARRRKADVRWSAALGRRLCARLAKGELLYHVLREAGMPTPEAVAKWAKARPAFGEALAKARAAGGRTAASRGPATTYNAGVAREVFERLCEGESLRAIGRDPTMPGLSTLNHWRERIPAFDQMVRTARRIQAERLCDLGLEMAMEATPDTAYLTQVRLNQLRWTAGVLAPNQFRTRPAPPPAPAEEVKVLIRSFKIEKDATTGARKVVAFCPNPVTGEVEREDAPGWRPPEGAVLLTGGFSAFDGEHEDE